MINQGLINSIQLNATSGVGGLETYILGFSVDIEVKEFYALGIVFSIQVLDRYTKGFGVSVEIRDRMTASAVISLQVADSAVTTITLVIDTAIVIYDLYTLGFSNSVTVQDSTYQISFTVVLSPSETFQLPVGITLSVYPSFTAGVGGQGVGQVVSLPAGQAENWKLIVVMAGVDISARLTGQVSVDFERNAAAVSVFKMRPNDGYVDPYKWVGAPVDITYVQTDNVGVEVYRAPLFKGVVDTPIYDTTSRVTEFTCTDNLQKIVMQMSHDEIDALTPLSVWSKYVYNIEVNGWDYLQQRLETYSYSMGLDINRNLFVSTWATQAIELEFTSAAIIDESLSVGLANARDIVNTFEVSLEYQYDQYRETVVQFSWKDTNWYTDKPLTWLFCSVQMICDAVNGSGGVFLQPPKFNIIPKSQFKHILPESGIGYETGFINSGQNLIAIEMQCEASKRYSQSINNKTTLQMSNAASVASLGPLRDSVSGSIEVKLDPLFTQAFLKTETKTKWLCTAGIGLTAGRDDASNHYTDPLLFVGEGWVPYPKLSYTYTAYPSIDRFHAPFQNHNHTIPINELSPSETTVIYDLNNTPAGGFAVTPGEHLYDFDDFALFGKKADRELALQVLEAQAKVKLLESHRQNRVAFKTPILPLVHRGQTVRVATPTMFACGPVQQVLHEFNIDDGKAITTVALALSSTKAIGIPESSVQTYKLRATVSLTVQNDINVKRVNGAVPVNVGALQYKPILPCHYHTGTVNPTWDGHITPANWILAPGANQYVVDFPTLPPGNTDNLTIDSTLDPILIDIPQDELVLSA